MLLAKHSQTPSELLGCLVLSCALGIPAAASLFLVKTMFSSPVLLPSSATGAM